MTDSAKDSKNAAGIHSRTHLKTYILLKHNKTLGLKENGSKMLLSEIIWTGQCGNATWKFSHAMLMILCRIKG